MITFDSRTTFNGKEDGRLYFLVPSVYFRNLEILEDMCELSINISSNHGVSLEVKIEDCDWKKVQLSQDEIIELLKMALKEV